MARAPPLLRAHWDWRGSPPLLPATAQKAIHCAELQITHFIDDRPDVLEALDGIVAYRYLFGPQRAAVPGGVIHCPDWESTERAVSSAAGPAP